MLAWKKRKIVELTTEMYDLIRNSNQIQQSGRGKALGLLNIGSKKRKRAVMRQNNTLSLGLNRAPINEQYREDFTDYEEVDDDYNPVTQRRKLNPPGSGLNMSGSGGAGGVPQSSLTSVSGSGGGSVRSGGGNEREHFDLNATVNS